MKLKLNFHVLLIIILGAGMSCETSDSLPCQTHEGEHLEIVELNSENPQNIKIKNINESEQMVNLIIENENDYKKYVVPEAGFSLPDIDFNNFTLLVGRYKAPNSDEVILKKLMKSCKEIVFKVEIGGGALPVPTDVAYFAILKKTNLPIIFDIEYQ